jgi:hypothetical protein
MSLSLDWNNGGSCSRKMTTRVCPRPREPENYEEMRYIFLVIIPIYLLLVADVLSLSPCIFLNSSWISVTMADNSIMFFLESN